MIFQVPFLAFWRLGRSADWWPLTHLQRKTCLPSFYRSIRVLGCTTRKSVRKVSLLEFCFFIKPKINRDFYLYNLFSSLLSSKFTEFLSGFLESTLEFFFLLFFYSEFAFFCDFYLLFFRNFTSYFFGILIRILKLNLFCNSYWLLMYFF